jgi:hypothetical protein
MIPQDVARKALSVFSLISAAAASSVGAKSVRLLARQQVEIVDRPDAAAGNVSN